MSDYIGKRIVPKHCGEWEKEQSYEMLCIVLDKTSGDSYISRCEVPAGTELTDKAYWALCSDFSQQIKDMSDQLSDTEARMGDDLSTTKETMSKELSDTKAAMSQELSDTSAFLTGKVDAADEALREGRTEMEETAEALSKRLDNLVSSATSDTELLDIRVDSEGETHASAGEAVRSITKGLVPKSIPSTIGVAIEKDKGNTADISLYGSVVKGEFSYAGASYVGLFAGFFGEYDTVKEKKYRVVFHAMDEIPEADFLVTNASRAWGSSDGTVGCVNLKTCSLKAGDVIFMDIDFSDPHFQEFVLTYPDKTELFFALRVQKHEIVIPAATVYFYAYELTDSWDLFWKYVSETDRLSILEAEVKDARNDGTEYSSLGEMAKAHGDAVRELIAARSDGRGEAFESLSDRLNNMDGLMCPRLAVSVLRPPRDNTNGWLVSEDGFMGAEVVNRNAVFRFSNTDFLSYEVHPWGSLHFSFAVSYDTAVALAHLDSLYLDLRIEDAEDASVCAGQTLPATFYINGYESWGTVINPMRTETVAIGQRNLFHLEEEEVRNVLAAGKPQFILFSGSFLNHELVAQMDRVVITASVIDRSRSDGLFAYTGYADVAETALFAHEAEQAGYAALTDVAELALHANSADSAQLADNFFLNAPEEILNIPGKRYSPGMDTADVPLKSPYTLSGGFQTDAKDREIVTEPGVFIDALRFRFSLSAGAGQPNNQGYVKNLSTLMTYEEMLSRFEEGYLYGYICALEDWEGYPESSKAGSHPQNLLISGYLDMVTRTAFVNNRSPATRRISDKLTLSVWKYQITPEQLASIRAAQAAETFRAGWFGIWNTRAYTEGEDALWEAVWYWSDCAFTDGSYSDEEMLTFFLNKYTYWGSLVNHRALTQRFTAAEGSIEELKKSFEGLSVVSEELSENVDGLSSALENAGIGKDIHITCWGDSLTAGGGWTTTLAALSGATVHNGGTGGENARCIAARQGADVMTINNITIPAECEPVTIAVRAEDTGITTEWGYKVTPLLQGGSHVNPVDIGGVLGTLRWTGANYADQTGIWTFTRSEAGEEVAITRPTAIRTAFDRERNGKSEIMVIFIGQNGGYTDIDDLIRTHRLMIDHFKGKEYVILGLSSGTAAQRADYEAAMTEAFGRRFVSLRAYLAHPIYDTDGKTIISCYGLDDAGLDPTDADIERIKNGQVPQTLLSDSVHYTAETKTVIGTMLYKKMVELGILE